MYKLLFLSFIAILSTSVSAQDFAYNNTVTDEEMKLKKYDKDTSAHAYVMAEFGKTSIYSFEESTPLVYEYHVKIKILDSKGFDKANVEIPFYTSDPRRFEKVTDVAGVTYYKDEKGNMKIAELDASKIYTVNENKYWNKVKFAMPNVQNGSIIEYKYKIESPYLLNFKTWLFQSDIPKVYSAYEVHIPAVYNYNVSMRGALKLTRNPMEIEQDCFNFHGVKCDCSKITYAIDNIPAFIEEDYMTSRKNFISGLYFELFEYTNLSNGSTQKLSKEWKDVDSELKRDESFGSQIKKKDLLKQLITPVIVGKTDDLSKAKAVYAYIQKNIKWNEINSMVTDGGVRKALDKHTGTTGDINLSLISALNAAGVNTEAVILSTREHGILSKLYPVISEFNYVIARATIGDKSYLLDATDPLLSFGMLPIRCLNDQGRVMSLDKPSYWIDIVTNQKQSTTYTMDLVLSDDGKLKGKLNRYSIGYGAFLKRKAIKKFNTVDEYVENLDERLTKVKITKYDITNLDSLDKPVAETYDIEIDAYNNLSNQVTFNPFLFDRLVTNPFKLTERNYPVDWGMPSEDRFILNLQLPGGYTIENPPKNSTFSLPGNGGTFTMSYYSDGKSFSFSHATLFNKSIYGPNEYPYLKELYNRIILSEKEEMMFKKKI